MSAAALVLASASAARASLLRGAGLRFEVVPAAIDERAVEAEAVRGGAGPVGIARRLAVAKALAVSGDRPDAVVIGADQTLSLGEKLFHKPADRAVAEAQIAALAGRTHRLASGVALARGGRVLADFVDTARLTMRPLDAAEIADYAQVVGPEALRGVGAYRIEGIGVRLFERIEGRHETIMGMPLLPLLAALRRLGVAA